MIRRYKTTLPPRARANRSWTDLRTLEDWWSDWDLLGWPAPWWSYAPYLVVVMPLDFVVCAVGSLERRLHEDLNPWP